MPIKIVHGKGILRPMIPASSRSFWAAAAAVLAALLATGLLYIPGLSGSFHFDDHPSLGGLEAVSGFESALLFVATNETGPTGRPVAMASFLLERDAYPDNPGAFLLTNILIHLVNGLLVFIFSGLLLTNRPGDARRAWQAAAVTGVIWVLLPLHAATVLLVVQRMASLAVSFMLLGAIGYLVARRHIERKPLQAFAGMLASLAVFGVLGLLTKENAAVLPLLLLICELTVLRRPIRLGQRIWWSWITIVLTLPSVFLAVYLLSFVPYSDGTVAVRGFTAGERLLTQTVILWQYLYFALLPSALKIHPFYDAVPTIRDALQPAVVVAITGWIAAISVAFFRRKTAPVLTLGVFWYLGAQLVESTLIPIELFFSHRSYLPLVGVAIMIGWGVVNLPPNFRRIGWFGLSAYAAVLAGVLFSTASIWGSPRVAAELWYAQQPESPRAIGFLVEQYVDEDNFQGARRLLERKSMHPRLGHLYEVQKLVVLCLFDQRPSQEPDLVLLSERLRRGGFTHGQTSSLRKLFELHSEAGCEVLELSDIRVLAKSLLVNPAYASSRAASHSLHTTIARISLALNDDDLAAWHFFEATKIRHDPSAVVQLFGIHSRHHDHEAMAELIEWMRENPPTNGVVRSRWLKLADSMQSSRK